MKDRLTYKEMVDKFKPLISKIMSNGKGIKAINDVIMNCVISFIETENDNLIFINQFMEDYNSDSIITDKNILWKEGNVLDSIDSKYKLLAKVLYTRRPVGFGTPTAAVGEGEFMFFILSPSVLVAKTKKTGDISINNINVELKGKDMRLFSNVHGSDVRSKLDVLGKKYNLKQNFVDNKGPNKSERWAYEPWGGKTKQPHWISEFRRIGKTKAIDFLYEVTIAMNISINKTDLFKCFDDDYNIYKFKKLIAKGFWVHNKFKWDYLTHIDNYIVKSVKNDEHDFFNKIDKEVICFGNDFMRIWQSLDIGFYLNFN